MKKVKVEDAVGLALAHDLTKIVPGKFKGPAFKKGHTLRKEDIPELLKMGKEYVYILELEAGEVHEDEAALRLADAIAGGGLTLKGPEEGRVNLIAKWDGLLKVNVSLVERINQRGEILLAVRHNNTPSVKNCLVAATRIVALSIGKQAIEEVEQWCRGSGKPVEVVPYPEKKIGVVVTGGEIYKGLIKDHFDEAFSQKLKYYRSSVLKKIIVPDEVDAIVQAVLELREIGSDIIFATAGLSVDPDDVTKKGLEKAGVEVVVYGVPVMPGSMFLYGRLGGIPVLGLPACVFHHRATVFDLIFPRILIGETLRREEILRWGYGGLCLNCKTCTFPDCGFGKS